MRRSTSSRRCRRFVTAFAAMTLAFGSAACGSGAGGGNSGDGETVELRFSYFSGENTSFGQLWSWWMDEVERRSGGQVQFERFWDGTLLDATQTLDGLKDGRIDLGQVSTAYYPGAFPLSSITEVPFITSNAPAVSTVFTELEESNEALEQEWTSQAVEPIAWHATAPSPLGSQAPLAGVADLRGKRIRAVDTGSRALDQAGANLINIEVSQIYSGMERDLVDAYYGVPFSFIEPLKLTEVTSHITDLGLGVASLNVLSMSAERWNELPENVKTVMAEVSREVPVKVVEFEAMVEDVTCEAARTAGIQMAELPEPEVAALRAAGQEPLLEAWREQVTAAGGSPDQFYEQYTQALEAAEAEIAYETGLQRCMERAPGQ